jgi:hypothetical protein
MLIELSLGLLLTITFFNVILGADFTTYTLESEYASSVGIDEITGALAIIIALIGISAIVGIKVLGSGISEQSVRTIIIIVGYGSIWGVFSVLAINLISSIELFGWVLYIALTVVYAIGVMNKLSN